MSEATAAIETARSRAGIGERMPEMSRQLPVVRTLARPLMRALLRAARIVTREQHAFNVAVADALEVLHRALGHGFGNAAGPAAASFSQAPVRPGRQAYPPRRLPQACRRAHRRRAAIRRPGGPHPCTGRCPRWRQGDLRDPDPPAALRGTLRRAGDGRGGSATWPWERLADASCDLIYLDADHRYESVSADAQVAVAKLKRSGVLVFNDYIMFDHLLGAPYGVVQAVNELVASGEWRVAGFALQQHMFCDIALRRRV